MNRLRSRLTLNALLLLFILVAGVALAKSPESSDDPSSFIQQVSTVQTSVTSTSSSTSVTSTPTSVAPTTLVTTSLEPLSTTTIPIPPTTSAPTTVIVPTTVYIQPSVATGSCVVPQHVCDQESGGDPMAYNPTGCGGRGCYGKYQFDPTTWDSVVSQMGRTDLIGNYLPDEATQDAVAAFLWAGGAGCSHWSAC